MVDLYDWRQVKRWGISEDSLPPGSIRHKTETLLGAHFGKIISALGVLVLKAALIAALLIVLVRHRRTERVFKARENRYRLLFEQLNDAVIIHGVVLRLGPAHVTGGPVLLGKQPLQATGDRVLVLAFLVMPLAATVE